MRTIKFRLRQDNKIVGYEKWYSGVETTDDNPCGATPRWLYSKDGKYWNPEPIKHNCKDSFTGLLDKNGREIYEGDIIKTTGQQILPISIDSILIGDAKFRAINIAKCEIIGNIYENPELLEKGK